MKFRGPLIFLFRRLLPIAAIIVLVLILLFFLFFDSLAQTVLNDVNRTFPGTISVGRFSPSFEGVTLNKVKWTLDSKDPVFEASQVSVDLGFGELWDRDWYRAVEEVDIERPGLRVIVDQNGNVNLTSLLPTADTTSDFDLSKLRTEVNFDNGWVLYKDQRDAGFLYELFDADGSVKFEDGENADFMFSAVPPKAGEVRLPSDNFEDADSRVTLSGEVSLGQPRLEAEFDMEKLDLSPFAGFPGFGPGQTLVQGTLDGSVRASGEGNNWSELLADVFLVGEVNLSQGAFRDPQMPAALKGLNGTLKLLGSEVTAESFEGELAEIGFNADGEAELGPGATFQGAVQTERFPISAVEPLLGRKLPITGEAEARLRARGTPEDYIVTGRVKGYNLEAEGEKVEYAEADILLNQEMLAVSDIQARTSAGTITGNGWVFLGPEPRILFSLQGENAKPDAVMPGLAQEADFNVRVVGDPSSPTVIGGGTLDGLGDWGQGLESASGNFVFSGDNLLLYDGEARSGGSFVELSLGAYDIAKKTFSGIVGTSNFQVADLPGISGLGDLRGQFSGSALVNADLSGETPDVSAQAVLSSGQFESGPLSVQATGGQLLFDGNRVVIPQATGRLDGSEVEVSGTYDLRNQALKFFAQADNFDLSTLGGPQEVADVRGSVEGILGGGLGVYGVAESARGKVAVSGLQEASGEIKGVAWVAGREQGLDVESIVVASGRPDNLNIDYTGQVSGPRLAGVGPLNLFGAADLMGRVLTIRPTVVAAPEAPDDSRLYPLTTYQGEAYSFFGPLLAGPLEKVVLTESPFPKARSFVVAGSADLGRGELDLGFQLRAAGLEELPLPELTQKLPFQILSGFGSLDGRVLGSLSSPRVVADFLFPWLMLGDDRDRRLTLGTRGSLAFEDDVVQVKNADVSQVSFDSRLTADRASSGADGLLNLQGFLSLDERFDLRVRTDGFSPSFFAFFAPDWVTGWVPSGRLATDSLHLWGSLDDPNISGEVRLKEGGMMVAGAPYPIHSAFADFTTQGEVVRISDLGFSAPGIEVTGQASRQADGKLDGVVRARNIELDRLHRFGGLFPGLSGEADLVARIDGSFPGNPAVQLAARTRELSWNPTLSRGEQSRVTIEELALGHFEDEDTLDIRSGLTLAPSDDGIYLELPEHGFRFRRSDSGLQLTASGAVDIPSSLVARLPFKTFSEITAAFASPAGPDFGHNGRPFEMSVNNLTSSEVARLTGRKTTGRKLATSFDLSLEGQWWRDHAADAGDKLPHYELTFRDLLIEGGASGARSGMRLDTVAGVEYQRQGDVGYLSVNNWQLGFFREIEAKEGEEVTPEDRILRQGVIDAGGRLAIASLPDTEPVSEFNLGAADIPLSNLSFLLPEKLPLSGLVESFEVNLRGVLPSPKLSIAGLVSNLTLGPLQNMKLDGSVTGQETERGFKIVIGEDENEGIALTFGDNDPTEHLVKIDGDTEFYWQPDPNPNPERLELFAKNLGLSLDSPIALSAEVKDAGLDVLAEAVPGEESTRGTFQGRLVTSGTLRRPEFEGGAELNDGRFVSRQYGRFEDLHLDAEINRINKEEATQSPVLEASSSGFLTRLVLNRLEGMLGGQPFFGGGRAEFAGISPTFLNLYMTGESLPVKLPGLFSGEVDFDIELDGEPAQSDSGPYLEPALSGLMVIPSGSFEVPLGGGDPTSGLSSERKVPLDVDLQISLGKDFFVEAFNSRVRAVGDLNLRTEDGVAKVYGQTALSRGIIRIPFYDANFRIRQGLAIFDGPFIPRLQDVEAVADLSGYRITARANGRYPDTFDLELYSVPPLPQAQLNRLAVVGGLPPQVTGQQVVSQDSGALGTLGNQGVSFLSGILTNRLTDKLGSILFLSELSLDYIPPATYAVKLAKALDPNDTVLLTLTRVIRDSGLNENLFGVEWRFTRTLLVRLAFDQLARARFWFQSLNRF